MAGEDSKEVKTHRCEQSKGAPWTVENRGEGWYLYSGDSRGANSINFCPGCGEPLGSKR